MPPTTFLERVCKPLSILVHKLLNQLPISANAGFKLLFHKSEKKPPIVLPNSLNQLPSFSSNSAKKPMIFLKNSITFAKPSLTLSKKPLRSLSLVVFPLSPSLLPPSPFPPLPPEELPFEKKNYLQFY